IGMHLDHPPTHEGCNIRQRVFVRPYDAGKGTVRAKCRSSDRLHRHTGSGHFIQWEPNKTYLACRMFRPILLSRRRRRLTVTGHEGDQQQNAEENPARRTQTASRASMTLTLICASDGRYDHASHLSCSHLEWPAHGALIPGERQGKFETRLIIIDGDLALDPLGIENLQEAGGALAEAQLGNTKRFLRLFYEPFLVDEDQFLRGFRLSSMLIDGASQVVPGANILCLFFSLNTKRRRNVPLLQIP